ncbi:MAG TPA: NmrA/HSCARG family protein [Mycobacterium sp.]|nr:NmrA/HSCARG family protein [Mycobacterium sp.]
MTIDSSIRPVAVIGATGKQGGAVVDALTKAGVKVRAAVRDPGAPRALALAERGVELAVADLTSESSVCALFDGASAAFTMTTMAGPAGTEGEVANGMSIARAAKRSGLPFLVYSSVGGAERGSGVPHFESKYRVEQALLEAVPVAFVRPTWFMENLTSKLEPTSTDIRLNLPLHEGVSLQMVSVRTIGEAAAAFLLDRPPSGTAVEIAGDDLTGEQIANRIAEHLGRPVTYVQQAPQTVTDADQAAMWRWLNKPPAYMADIERTRALVPDAEDLQQWLARRGLGSLEDDRRLQV